MLICCSDSGRCDWLDMTGLHNTRHTLLTLPNSATSLACSASSPRLPRRTPSHARQTAPAPHHHHDESPAGTENPPPSSVDNVRLLETAHVRALRSAMATGQIKQDLNRSGWETTDFPSVCERCLPDNPYVQMLKEDYGAVSVHLVRVPQLDPS